MSRLKTTDADTFNDQFPALLRVKDGLGPEIFGTGTYASSTVTKSKSTATNYFQYVRSLVDRYNTDLVNYNTRKAYYEASQRELNAHNGRMNAYNTQVGVWNRWVESTNTPEAQAWLAFNPGKEYPGKPPQPNRYPPVAPPSFPHPGNQPTYQGPSKQHIVDVRDHWQRRVNLITLCTGRLRNWRNWNAEAWRYIEWGIVNESGDSIIGIEYSSDNTDLSTKVSHTRDYFAFVKKYDLYHKGNTNETAKHAEKQKDTYSQKAIEKIDEMIEIFKINVTKADESISNLEKLNGEISSVISAGGELITHMSRNGF